MKKFAIILSGCGVYDGSEIHEAVTVMLAIDLAGHEYRIFAPDMMQSNVINHLTKKPSDENRNILVEASRIARGKIIPLSDLSENDFDSLIFPGGFGVAKNLCNYAIKGAEMKLIPEVRDLIIRFHSQRKPIGAMCISPVLLAKAIPGCRLTIGNETETANNIERLGSHHVATNHGQVCIDTVHKIVSTPCYMLDASISQVFSGAQNLISAILKLMH